MRKDGEIKLLLDERGKGTKQKLAAARAGMCERTARKYERIGKLASQIKRPRAHRTRENPFTTDWPWVEARIQDDPALQVKTCLRCCVKRFPGATRKDSCVRCSDTCKRGECVTGPSRR